MRKLIIIRGWPGSGKTAFALRLVRAGHVLGFIEADQYFIRSDGIYDFNPRLLPYAHRWCFGRVERLLDNAGDSGAVIVSNTFTRRWEMEGYVKLARRTEAELVVYRCTGSFDNVHGVPPETVQRMRESMEDFPGEILV